VLADSLAIWCKPGTPFTTLTVTLDSCICVIVTSIVPPPHFVLRETASSPVAGLPAAFSVELGYIEMNNRQDAGTCMYNRAIEQFQSKRDREARQIAS
jgi:hypothetical protein